MMDEQRVAIWVGESRRITEQMRRAVAALAVALVAAEKQQQTFVKHISAAPILRAPGGRGVAQWKQEQHGRGRK